MCWREKFHWNLSFIPCTLFKKEKKGKETESQTFRWRKDFTKA
jgi:hypothetical protein